MKGLLLKDLYLLKGYSKQYMLVFGFMAVFSFASDVIPLLSFYLVMFGSMMTLTTMAVDENTGFGRMALSTPVTPEILVRSKYILLAITVGVGAILSSLLSLLTDAIQQTAENGMGIENVLGIVFGVSISYSVMFPFVFKLGMEKGRYVYIGILLLFFIVVVGGAELLPKAGIDLGTFEASNKIGFLFSLLCVWAAALVISYGCSLKIVKNKEW